MSGWNVMMALKTSQKLKKIPAVIMTAAMPEDEEYRILSIRAAGILLKPFGVVELLARVRAVLRRTEAAHTISEPSSLKWGDVHINFAERRVTVAEREVKLTPTEHNLLRELALNVNKVLTHHMLLSKVWGPGYADEREYLRVFIGHLRKELEPDPQKPRYILTIPGVGYRLNITTA